MTQVIVYTNNNGGVSMTIPTGELPIEQVLTKDCPAGAIIVDDSELSMEDFDAWELVNGKVIVNQTKKQAIINKTQIETSAKESALSKLTALGLTETEVKALLGAT
jgi:hypothetical protein